MYTIGQVAEMFQLPVSTLRYYDKEGLFPNISRKSGIRDFGISELNSLRVIECLKKSGLEIKQIKDFMQLCQQGNKTYRQRHELFLRQKAQVEAEIARLYDALDMINYKCWYYEEALAHGSEEELMRMINHPETMPPEIRELFDKTHSIKEAPAAKLKGKAKEQCSA